MRKVLGTIAALLLASSLALAQGPGELPEPGESPEVMPFPGPGEFHARFQGEPQFDIRVEGPGMGMRGPGPGKWWKNPELAQKLALTDDQISKMEKIFQDHRLKLIDVHAALEKQEVILEPMVEADHPDENQVLVQIDRVAQARAELEKANARMLLGIRSVLTPEQWKKLQAERANTRNVERDNVFFWRQRGDSGPATAKPPGPPKGPPPPGE
jgi:periplasmic protein CpxP/Spy